MHLRPREGYHDRRNRFEIEAEQKEAIKHKTERETFARLKKKRKPKGKKTHKR
jgi:hypothetical protein